MTSLSCLAATPHRILDRYDALLVDLDGTVFRGGEPVDGAREGLSGRASVFVTNNASRSPREVAEHLTALGFDVVPSDVLTSAQAACALAASLLGTAGESQPTALVVGAASFRDLAVDAGFRIVDSADERPDVVLHGHSPQNNWTVLSEAALAVRAGAEYVASNMDTTLPSERGLLIGNGSLVAAVVSATGVTPHSAGKPGPAMFEAAARQLGARRPLAVGDRLDTDIAGGIAAGVDTLCVLTGVSGHREILHTPWRPTWIAANLRDHLDGWSAAADGDTVVVASGRAGSRDIMAAEALAVAAPLVWAAEDRGETPTVVAASGDTAAVTALEAWR
ncbi:HAD-IIA family hydrolase [uncultured Corynebacterium sp.]|uniref:HAD-IIA family hydrolase n=1 Tax=uncultured Corynebacterium sp. TaxID=159447 RepID=UPI0025DB6243|nr:HAD-IIA family hydrolase [uncultured Corynebacterium sp.]